MNNSFTTPIVSVEWLKENIDNSSVIVLDATIKKVVIENSKKVIPNALFFDFEIKNLMILSIIIKEFKNTLMLIII